MRNTIFALLALLPLTAMAAGEFVVRDMRVEGLQRISEGTVFNYLPINVGDTVDKVRIGEAIRALYAQDLFDDVEMRRDGDTLIVVVKERPSIESFNIEGNKDIKTEDLMESLRAVGLARGRTFNRSVLDNVEMFLREQYYDRGKYGVVIDTNIQTRPNNTVRVQVDVNEGDRAKIRQVNIVGNETFDEDEIRADFTLDTANWLSWIRQDDRYSKEALEGDLEILRSFYMDRGYADFKIDSTQVAISPNKKDIFVTINIKEGDVYTVSDIKLVGEMVAFDPEARPSGREVERRCGELLREVSGPLLRDWAAQPDALNLRAQLLARLGKRQRRRLCCRALQLALNQQGVNRFADILEDRHGLQEDLSQAWIDFDIGNTSGIAGRASPLPRRTNPHKRPRVIGPAGAKIVEPGK